jgi:Flp pilus assembly protein TadB
MSKERAQRRAERERASAIRTAARAAERERTERREARRKAVTRWLPARPSRPTGILAERRRTRLRLLVTALVLVQVVVWLFRPDWPARLAALVVSLLLFPLLLALTT